jgi:hypothetical protein
MKSPRKLTTWFRLLFAFVVFAIALTLLIKGSSDPAAAHSPQAANGKDTEKSLNIERYPTEVFALVDLKIGQNSVKSSIKSKFKNNRNQSVLDDVKFKETDDWSKNVKVRLRNVSGQPIYGMSASLFFQHTSSRTAFETPLSQHQSRDLKQRPLQPGDDVDLEVTDADFNETIMKVRQYGLDPNELPVLLSVNSALFSDDFAWIKGSLMRRDPDDHKKWNAVDKFDTPEARRLK